jgi:hypothetical protein
MAINKKQIKELLESHRFEDLFIEELGWDEYKRAYPLDINDTRYELQPIAQKRGFVALHCPSIPDAATRAKIENKVSKDIREHLIIFTDSEDRKQRWQWVRRIPGQPLSRKEHEYLPHQPMLLIERIGYLEVPVDEEDHVDLLDMFDKVKAAFNIDKVTKKFYERFKKEHDAFLKFIDGIADMGDAQWYASVMLNRLMFIYFIQKKGFLDGDIDYLRNRLARVQELKGKGKFHTFYRYFMLSLCHEVLAKKERTLDKDLAALIGNVPYLNGGIFQPHELEMKYGDEIGISDDAFEKIFNFFDQYEWHLDNRPNASEEEINPDVLGYIFEKYINQKQMGAYYTKEDITEYISKNTIIPCLFDKAQKACKIAFEGETSVWNLLKDDPDRYIYTSVRHGVTYDIHNDVELDEPVPYPPEIEVGLDTTKENLLERRKQWNTQTPVEAGLPTEIWRETVARRQRYAEVQRKLKSGEVQSINDLITLNLDIRQFAQDVIERSESPDLLNAFWVAIAGRMPQHSNEEIKPGITVLDPTCGSGAFLFAALNILEPLYEACLERMKGFLEEWGDHPKHRNYASFFKSIREDIGRHPSPKYFIYKSIIIHNLYGVDIMKEAVEICKLRLFLKLVAQVEDGDRIEPLPDIDFNIRAGNTLVGFATEDEMKRAMQGDLLAYATVLPEILEQAEECNRLFNLFREAQLEGDGSLGKAKAKLSGKLNELNGQLNQYLASDYGVDPAKSKQYGAFLDSHQPFHWFIEFYGIIKSGGFDGVVGNPPYVEYSKIKGLYRPAPLDCFECKNLYAYVMERCEKLLTPEGRLGFIVPIALAGVNSVKILRDKLASYYQSLWLSHFAIRPAKLFTGVEQRLTITLCERGANEKSVFSSNYNQWVVAERATLFSTLRYANTSEFVGNDDCLRFPKTGVDIGCSIFRKLSTHRSTPLRSFLNSGSKSSLIFHRTPGYWVRIMNFEPYFKSPTQTRSIHHIRELKVADEKSAQFAGAVVSSSLYFWWFFALGNCRNLTYADIYDFPAGEVEIGFVTQSGRLFLSLMEDFQKHSFTNHRGDTEFQEFEWSQSKPIIDEIDKVMAEHYGFTEEELDYIINYDIKYRMGKDLLEE